MQKTSIKASILIWATFLSLIITVSFVSISTKINKNLKNNSELTSKIEVNNEISNIINSGSLINNQYILSNGDKIILDDLKTFSGTIKKLEIHKSIINNDTALNISILNSTAPVKYQINSFSGVISSSLYINTSSGELIITSLGGYSKIKITSDINSNYLTKYRNYKIIKTIGNKEVIQSKGKIKNF